MTKSYNDLTSQAAILKAVAEADELGRMAFLKKYGFKPSRSYFLQHKGEFYDSKAIVGAAYGYQFPEDGPLKWNDFNGGEKTVQRKLEDLGFELRILHTQPISPSTPLVLVENETTAGGHYDSWKDVTGELYHFPNQYKNKVVSGRPFVYYRGTRRKDKKRSQPEYFGCGRVGQVWSDPDTIQNEPKDRKWFASIEDYRPFPSPVPSKHDGRFLEQIPQNHWAVGVRELPKSIYRTILDLAKITAPATTPPQLDALPPLEDVKPKIDTNAPIVLLHPKGKDGSRGPGSTPPRRSPYAKEIGDRAEEIVLQHLKSSLTPEQLKTLRWVANERETPGWDIEYLTDDSQVIAVEVKGTCGAVFPYVEMTANEWRAANELGSNYWLYLVADCLSKQPVIKPIRNPGAMVDDGTLSAIPALWRINF